MARPIRFAVIAVLLAGLMASCSAGTPARHPVARTTPSSAAAGHTAERLVGFWRVMSGRLIAPGELPEVVRFGGSPDDFADFRNCGVVTGQWRATEGGALVASVPFKTKYCSGAGQYGSPPWIDFTWGYRFSGSHLLLLNNEGDVQAYLQPAEPPTGGKGATAALLSPPTPTAALDATLSTPAPLPNGMTAVVKPTQASGTWLLPGQKPGEDGLSLLGDAYLGSFASCVVTGQFAYDTTGFFVAAGNSRGDCDSLPLRSWLSAATRLGLDHGKLAFVDRTGRVLGELLRHS
ncbi:MAG: hypothetical protein QOC82_2664 [Frankiaceae bacterium]|jgi:hypothetical protein|nr:hypothetical protein [Frankiaceae bacterium]